MLKNNKGKLIISSIITILPVLFGLIVWDKLPETLTTHWGADGVADGHSGRLFSVVGLPLIMLALHLLIIVLMNFDKNKEKAPKMLGMMMWIMPVISLLANGVMYAVAFDADFRFEMLFIPVMGLLFVAMGNYMPKCRQNNTIGIKIKWTLASEENWNATHRFAGKVWVIGGLLVMASVLLPAGMAVTVMIISMFVLIIIPMVYSGLYHKKQVKEGAEFTPVEMSKGMKGGSIAAKIMVPVILVLVGVFMLSGNIDMVYEADSFTIDADFHGDLTVEYDAVESIEYMDNHDVGVRTFGFGSARLQAGSFRSDEFGNYTRYAYVGCKACVVLKVEGKTLVITGRDAESTKAIYDELTARIDGENAA